MDTFVALTRDRANWRRIIREDNLIYFQANEDGDRVGLVTEYSPADHRWWQLRHNDATDSLIYETSPDGISWQHHYEVAAPDWLDSAFVELQAGTLGAVAEPGEARFLSFAVEPSMP